VRPFLTTWEYRKLRKSGLFNADYYLELNPDVTTDPLLHYLSYGQFEGRCPEENFDADFYVLNNSDVNASSISPYVHYLIHGKNEGRAGERFTKERYTPKTERFGLPLTTESGFDGYNPSKGEAKISSNGIIRGWVEFTEPPPDRSICIYLDGELSCCSHLVLTQNTASVRNSNVFRFSYVFEVPKNLVNDCLLEITVRHKKSGQVLPGATFSAPPATVCRSNNAIDWSSIPLEMASRAPHRDPKKPPSIAVIVLNLNGEALLEEFFSSFLRFTRYTNFEIIIIDHNSSDRSLDVCTRYADNLPIKAIKRDRNYSFSESNNWAAKHTEAEHLIFANNDLVFCQDVLGEFAELLNEQSNGIVGIKLMDPPTENSLTPQPLVQHCGVFFEQSRLDRVIAAFESRSVSQLFEYENSPVAVPCVTGAFMGIRHSVFDELGGFDEEFFYGCEDIEICLRAAKTSYKVIAANSVSAFHDKGTTRLNSSREMASKMANNWEILNRKHASWFRIRRSQDLLKRPGFWSSKLPKIAFAVTDSRESATAGDFFTAKELGSAIQRIFPCDLYYPEHRARNWYDMSGIDVLIVMRDDYDLRSIKNSSPHLIKIGWARNWIDRWTQRPWIDKYDLLWGSSNLTQQHLSSNTPHTVDTIRIATNTDDFGEGEYDAELASDYCFTGSHWGHKRDIEHCLDPEIDQYKFKLFGYGWEKSKKFARFAYGPLPYCRMKDVYRSCKIVVDDANFATAKWGSVNSRVFDALASGALVISNGKLGNVDAFGGLLPTYQDAEDLRKLIRYYMENEVERNNLVHKLRKVVHEKHTYSIRADQAITSIQSLLSSRIRFAIKIGAPNMSVAEEWGDYHFALGIKKALQKHGHTARIDCLDCWYGDNSINDDVVLVLRGLSEYQPNASQINLMWNISHPDKVTLEEYELYDHVFVASVSYTEKLKSKITTEVSCLLQCTDPELFSFDDRLSRNSRALIVGNSRNVFRKVVEDAITADIPLDVYGTRWEQFIGKDYLRGSHIKNTDLARHYQCAGVVLNDHWDTMKQYGFISNRLFDAVACGANVVSDDVEGLSEILGPSVQVYRSSGELREHFLNLSQLGSGESKNAHKAAREFGVKHSFDNRVCDILSVVMAKLENDPAQVKPSAKASRG